MNRTLVALALVAGVAIACGPVSPVVTPIPLRPLEVHLCVPGASIWVDGDKLPSPPLHVTADANGVAALPAIRSDITQLNLHGTAPGLTEYGDVIFKCEGTATTDCLAAGTDRLRIFARSCTR